MRKLIMTSILLLISSILLSRAFIDSLRVLADSGDPEAQFELGFWYYQGWGIEENRIESLRLFKRASEQGFTPAYFYIGFCYANGNGVIKDNLQAVKYWTMAANAGYAEAQYWLAECYAKGDYGVKRNPKEAKRLYVMAAEQGDNDALLRMSRMTKNKPEEVFLWSSRYNRAKSGVVGYSFWFPEQFYAMKNKFRQDKELAEQGDKEAQYSVGTHYEYGNGVDRNYAEAFKWYKRSADAGNVDALYAISVCYGLGIGVPVDRNEAYFWELIAAASSTQSSGGSSWKTFISEKQKKKTQERARIWFEGK